MIRKDLVLVALFVAIISLMIIPLSQVLIDALLAFNISVSILFLILSVYLKHPSDFATFPSVILISTAFRLSLSIATTRLILSDADGGQIIDTFGNFVARGSLAIGLVVFLIITVVQFLVITKGAERVAEVGARFALDAMPGKQMSIDADVRAGTIDAEVGMAKREQLDKESQFFGAMDGAMKFVKGDAVAGLVIIVINLVGGISVGMGIHELSFGDAVAVFSLLTIGDGLVAQIPALMISLCAGTVITRTKSDSNVDLGSDIIRELVADVRVPAVASLVVLAFGLIPGFPFLNFLTVAALLFFSSLALRRQLVKDVEEAEAATEEETQDANEVPKSDAFDDENLVNNRFGIEVSIALSEDLNLLTFKEELSKAHKLLNELIGLDLLLPFVVDQTSNAPETRSVVFLLDGVAVQKVVIPEGVQLCAGEQAMFDTIGCPVGQKYMVDWPIFNGFWVPNEFLDECSSFGIEAEGLEQELARLCYHHYHRLLPVVFSYRDYQRYANIASEFNPEIQSEIEDKWPRAQITALLRFLLEEGVPLSPIWIVQETIHTTLVTLPNATIWDVGQAVRMAMRRQLCDRMVGDEAIMGVVLISPKLEVELSRILAKQKDVSLQLPEDLRDHLLNECVRIFKPHTIKGRQLVLLAESRLRYALRKFFLAHNYNIAIISPSELATEIETHPLDLLTSNKEEKKLK